MTRIWEDYVKGQETMIDLPWEGLIFMAEIPGIPTTIAEILTHVAILTEGTHIEETHIAEIPTTHHQETTNLNTIPTKDST